MLLQNSLVKYHTACCIIWSQQSCYAEDVVQSSLNAIALAYMDNAETEQL